MKYRQFKKMAREYIRQHPEFKDVYIGHERNGYALCFGYVVTTSDGTRGQFLYLSKATLDDMTEASALDLLNRVLVVEERSDYAPLR